MAEEHPSKRYRWAYFVGLLVVGAFMGCTALAELENHVATVGDGGTQDDSGGVPTDTGSCNKTEQNCSDDVDDDCDQKPDCLDPDCMGQSACIPEVPAPFALAAVVDGGDAACPVGLAAKNPIVVNRGLIAAGACTGCTCEGGCLSSAKEYTDSACANAVFGSDDLVSSACLNRVGGLSSTYTAFAAFQNATCNPKGTPVATPVTWSDSKRVCQPDVLARAGCEVGKVCAPVAASCVFSETKAGCPSGYTPHAGDGVYYTTASGTRPCGTCACTSASCAAAKVRVCEAAFDGGGCNAACTDAPACFSNFKYAYTRSVVIPSTLTPCTVVNPTTDGGDAGPSGEYMLCCR